MLHPNILRCLVNQSAKSDRFLHTQARHVLDEIVKTIQRRPDLGPPVAEVLLAHTDSGNFDKASGTNTVQEILTICFL